MNIEDIKDDYVKLVYDAMRNVSKEFFEIEIAKGIEEKRRERVYCYELYHQIRSLQEKNNLNDFTVNAEIDKRGHSIITENFNPDIVIHQQGDMVNYIVVEVKVTLNAEGIAKDFNTIITMLEKYKYQYGIFILTGSSLQDFKHYFINNVLNRLEKNQVNSQGGKIYILVKEKHQSNVEVSTLKELCEEDKCQD